MSLRSSAKLLCFISCHCKCCSSECLPGVILFVFYFFLSFCKYFNFSFNNLCNWLCLLILHIYYQKIYFQALSTFIKLTKLNSFPRNRPALLTRLPAKLLSAFSQLYEYSLLTALIFILNRRRCWRNSFQVYSFSFQIIKTGSTSLSHRWLTGKPTVICKSTGCKSKLFVCGLTYLFGFNLSQQRE